MVCVVVALALLAQSGVAMTVPKQRTGVSYLPAATIERAVRAWPLFRPLGPNRRRM